MDEELLISLVSNYQELFDLQHPYYDDNQRRNNIWEEIGGIVKRPAQECRDRWKRIRDNYRRARKLRKTKSGQAAKNLKDPKYSKLLSFLTPYMDSEIETESNLPPVDSPLGGNITDEDNGSHSNDAGLAGTSSRSTASSPANVGTSVSTPQTSHARTKWHPYKVQEKSSTEASETSSVHSLFQNYIERMYKTQKETHTVTAFFQNLGEAVKTFPEEIQIRVKREVFKIVSNAEEEVCLLKTKKQVLDSNQSIPRQEQYTHNSKQHQLTARSGPDLMHFGNSSHQYLYLNPSTENCQPDSRSQDLRLTMLQPATSVALQSSSNYTHLLPNATARTQGRPDMASPAADEEVGESLREYLALSGRNYNE